MIQTELLKDWSLHVIIDIIIWNNRLLQLCSPIFPSLYTANSMLSCSWRSCNSNSSITSSSSSKPVANRSLLSITSPNSWRQSVNCRPIAGSANNERCMSETAVSVFSVCARNDWIVASNTSARRALSVWPSCNSCQAVSWAAKWRQPAYGLISDMAAEAKVAAAGSVVLASDGGLNTGREVKALWRLKLLLVGCWALVGVVGVLFVLLLLFWRMYVLVRFSERFRPSCRAVVTRFFKPLNMIICQRAELAEENENYGILHRLACMKVLGYKQKLQTNSINRKAQTNLAFSFIIVSILFDCLEPFAADILDSC